MNSLNVCVVDDDDIHQYVMETTLEDVAQVKHIFGFMSAIEALDYFIENKSKSDKLPDILFLDLNMPGMDGREFLAALNTHYKHLAKQPHIWVLSSSTLKADLEIANEYPIVNKYFTKQISYEEIQDQISFMISA